MLIAVNSKVEIVTNNSKFQEFFLEMSPNTLTPKITKYSGKF